MLSKVHMHNSTNHFFLFAFCIMLLLSATAVSAATPVPKPVLQKMEAHLIIPKIKVNAVVQDMGMTAQGAMAVPANRVDVGWFSLGTRPGMTGSAVIGGHNYWNGTGVFVHLNQLKKGDTLTVVDAKGVSTSFVVREIRTYDATDTHSGIFQSLSGVHLNLITCSGVWNPLTRSYTKRLVIFTDVYQAPHQSTILSVNTTSRLE